MMPRTDLISAFKHKMGKNFITPDVIKYKAKRNRVVELSQGDFLGKDIYGVTVRDYQSGKWKDPELSKSFATRKSADNYAKKVLEKVI